MKAEMKSAIRRRVELALAELQREMSNQGEGEFKFTVTDYAGGLTVKLEEVAEDRPLTLGGSLLGFATLAPEKPEDGDE